MLIEIKNTKVRIMPYITINISTPNKEIYNHINDVNHAMLKLQWKQLSNLMQKLIAVHGNKYIY